MELFYGIIIGILIAVIGWLFFRKPRTGQVPTGPRAEIQQSIESMRAVGKLVVLKVFTQQVVTVSDHMLGDWGEKYMG